MAFNLFGSQAWRPGLKRECREFPPEGLPHLATAGCGEAHEAAGWQGSVTDRHKALEQRGLRSLAHGICAA